MDLIPQTYHDTAAPLCGVRCPAPTGVQAVLSAIWLWLGVVSTHLLGRGVMDRGRDDTRPLYPHNRTTQRRGARFAARAVPPARNYAPFYQYAARGLSPTQFMERLCRLSVHGRISVYRMIYWSSRMVREAVMAMFTRGDFRMADGVWDAHSVPD